MQDPSVSRGAKKKEPFLDDKKYLEKFQIFLRSFYRFLFKDYFVHYTVLARFLLLRMETYKYDITKHQHVLMRINTFK